MHLRAKAGGTSRVKIAAVEDKYRLKIRILKRADVRKF
jgi:hypothetical protein